MHLEPDTVTARVPVTDVLSLPATASEALAAAGITTSETGWDSTMICYPFVVTVDDRTLLFYNGNGFGQTGIGYAVWQEQE